MLEPIVEGFKNRQHEKVASELEYYLNCETCSELVRWLRQSPNDEVIVEALFTLGMNVCLEVTNRQACIHLKERFKDMFVETLFKLVITENFICSYIVPLCEKKFS
jgi:hypothetical protein